MSQIRQERTLSIIEQYTSFAQDKEFAELKTRAIWNGDFDSVTTVEWNQIRDYELARSARLEDVFFQYNQGLIDVNMYKFALAMGASRLGLWKWLNVGEPNPEFAVAIADFMENENFKAYAPEDKERFYRFTTLGYSVGRINNYVYHLEHARGENSWFSNPHMESNMAEWNKIQGMSKDNLLQYYSEQEYLKKYACV